MNYILSFNAVLAFIAPTAGHVDIDITIALAFKAVFFALALLRDVQLWMAVLADVGAALLVTLNGLRLLNARLGTTKS